MTPDFVKAVDPVFEMMIDLKEQIEQKSAPTPEAIRGAFIRRFSESEKLLHQRPEVWDLARYALVAWIDEQLASSLAWSGSEEWNKNKLQFDFSSNMSARNVARERFFERAKDAEEKQRKDALEVYFMCVVLGFQGVYKAVDGLATPHDIGVPDAVEDWLRKTREWIKLNPAKVNEKRPATVEHDANPHDGKYHLLGMVMAFIVTSIVASLAVYFWCWAKA